MLLTAQLTVLEAAVFIIAAVVLLIAVRFVILSKRGLDKYLGNTPPIASKEKQSLFTFARQEKDTQKHVYQPATDHMNVGELSRLKKMLLDQQSQLSTALVQINSLSNETTVATKIPVDRNAKELGLVLEKKDAELQKLKQQVDISKKMQSHFDEMEEEIGMLQQKMQKLEQQAWEANDLAAKLENQEALIDKLENDLLRKEEKLRELITENQRMQSLFHETEDKLNESNLQRQQLVKKMRFVEEMNGDMKAVADTNRKLQTELRRIAELESMLNLITEERDHLLKRGILKKF
jgi:myosin heavy subunit